MTQPTAMTNLIPLTSSRVGQQVRVARVAVGPRMRFYKYAIRLTSGTPADLAVNGGGPTMLSVPGSRVMDRGGKTAQAMVAEV